MPRFGISSMGDGTHTAGLSSSPPPPAMSMASFPSPGMTTLSTIVQSSVPQQGMPFSNNKDSVRLYCASGDGRAIFSLNGNDRLERRTLPLHNEATNELNPPQVATLPPMVQTALEMIPPVELVYVGGDNHKPFRVGDDNALPPSLLCLYTRKNVFYLEMTMNAQGEILVEPTMAYDNFFLNADDALTIVRIRPAPQRREGHATFSPQGAMAMLTHNPRSNEYSLVLQHNKDQDLASLPLRFYLEESSEWGEDITDFCFAQSDGLALLSTMSVLLLKGSGQVHAASPILFDGSVIHKSALAEAMEYVDHQIECLEDHNNKADPKYKQCRATKQFLQDAFGDSEGNFLTAAVISQARMHSAVTWPVKLQGPILAPSRSNTPGGAAGCSVSIENFSSSDLIGVAIGGEGHAVDLGIISPSCLLPRFTFESEEDGYAIDDKLMRGGAVVQRLLLSEEGPTGMPVNNQSLALICDPLMDSMLHFVTAKGVTTVNTTAMRHALRKLQGQKASDGSKNVTPKTTAWSSMQVSSGSVQGAVVGTDPRFGHGLFVGLSSGSLVPINVTESRYLHEMEHLVNPDTEKAPTSSSISDNSVKRMEELQPLYEVVEPIMKTISAGLAGMGKIVGSQTASKDVTPDQLAVAIAVKQRCDEEVFLNLLALKRTVLARREILKTMYKEQKKQITVLKTTLGAMQERTIGLKDKAASAQENAKSLSERGTAAFQACHDLQPKITQAEYEFFAQLKRQRVQLDTFEGGCSALMKDTENLRSKINKGEIICEFELDKQNIQHADQLLDGEEKLMANIEATLKASERMASQLTRESGVAAQSAQ